MNGTIEPYFGGDLTLPYPGGWWTSGGGPRQGPRLTSKSKWVGEPVVVDLALTRPLLVQGGWVWTLAMLCDIKHIKADLGKMDVTFNGACPDSQFCPIVKVVFGQRL